MKTIELLFQETEIHFLLQNEGDVMVNATEMAKLFGRKTTKFLKTENTKAFIEVLKRDPNGSQIIEDRGRNGIYFNRKLALKFAAWLSPEFENWVFDTIDNLIFGNYKKHWDAHVEKEKAKEELYFLKQELLADPTTEKVQAFFAAQNKIKAAEKAKKRAINQQYKLF